MQANRQPALPGTPAFLQFSTPTLEPPEVPDHQLLCPIGRGSFGEVWMARNAIGTLRAVKIVHRARFERPEDFEREFKGLLKIEPISRSHDGLVDILQIGRRDDDGYFFYVMELADAVPNANDAGQNPKQTSRPKAEERTACGTGSASDLPPSPFAPDPSSLYMPHTLRSELQLRGRLPPDQCVAIGLKLSAALEHLHTNGLVHRDIKPSNIIFVGGQPKLADIGLVTAIDEAHSMVGTVGYIPPEGPGAPQADLYSLGKVLYEMALGKDRREFPQLPVDLPAQPDYAAFLELNEIILRACESDPQRRYPSAAAMQSDLTLLQGGQSVKRARTRERHWATARKLSLAGAAVAVVSAGLVLFNVHNPEYTPKPEAVGEYELGHMYYNQLTTEAHKKALLHLNKAVELDPKFLKPFSDLVAIHAWGQEGVFADADEKLRKTKELADRLLALDPMLAEGHAALAQCRFIQRDWRGAEDEIVRAIQLNPRSSVARLIYVSYLSLQGRAEEAKVHAEVSKQLDRSARTTALLAALPYFAARQFDLAIAQGKRVLELETNWASAHLFLGRCYEAQSNYPAAIEAWKRFDLLSGRVPATADYDTLLEAYGTFGQEGYLRKAIDLIDRDTALPESEKFGSELEKACYYARLGENEKALEALEKNAEKGFQNQLLFEPMFDTLHDDPRFKALLKRSGLGK